MGAALTKYVRSQALPGAKKWNGWDKAYHAGWDVLPVKSTRVLRSPEQTTTRLLFLFSHGNAEDVLSALAFHACVSSVLHAETIAYEYDGYGALSESEATEEALTTNTEDAASFAYALSRLRKLPLVLYGRSLGAALAIKAALVCRADALVLQSPFLSVMQVRVPALLCKHLLSEFDLFENDQAIRRLEETIPIFISHGTNDEVVPFAHGRSLSEISNGMFQPLNAGHNDVCLRDEAREQLTKSLQVFLESRLQL